MIGIALLSSLLGGLLVIGIYIKTMRDAVRETLDEYGRMKENGEFEEHTGSSGPPWM